MSILPAGAVTGTPFVPPTVSRTTPATTGPGFAQALSSVEQLTGTADHLATGVATGSLTDLHSFTTAAAKASLGVDLTVAVRNRAVEAYQEIMRMQV